MASGSALESWPARFGAMQPDAQQNLGYFAAPQPDGLDVHTDESAWGCTAAAARMAQDLGSQ
jgi:hypothetical protein